jgi:putative Mg2+ transporter-C (MgtC) family protein
VTFDRYPVLDAILRLGLSFLLVLPLAWEREQRSRSGGLRTYALLSMTVSGFLLLAQRTGAGPSEQADAFYGVLFGLGLVCSGAILRSREHVRGLSTAVGLWVSGAIGAGVAYGNVALSAAVSLLSVMALWAPSLGSLKKEKA